jgi:hypothetical protein
MAAPVGGANEDGDVGSSRGAWGSIVEYEDRATAGLGGRHSWDGDGENPAAAQFDRQQNPLIETRAN